MVHIMVNAMLYVRIEIDDLFEMIVYPGLYNYILNV